MAANQNVTQLTQQTVSADTTSLFYAVTGGTTDTGLPLSVFVHSLGLTGVPTTPTAALSTNTTQIASCAFVQQGFAPLASPTFTGNPTLPTGTIAVTQTPGNSSTAVATTAFVTTSFAPLASPTLTGVPVAPTASTGTSTTQLSTTAFVANTFAAPPSYGATTPGAVHATTISATGLISPTSTMGIAGTITNDNTQAGSVGEHITATGSAVSLTNNVLANITSISLSAGDWEVMGSTAYNPAGTTTMAALTLGISATSATLPASGFSSQIQTTFTTGTNQGMVAPSQRFLLSTTTTIFLVTIAGFGVSTMTTTGTLRARRVR